MPIRSRFIRIFDNYPLEPFQMADLPSLVKLEKQAFPVDYWVKEDFLEELAMDPDCLRVIRDNGRVIGYVPPKFVESAVVTVGSNELAKSGLLPLTKTIAGKRLGEKLFTFGVKRLKELKASRIIINTRLDNHPMKTLAENKFGFEVSRVIKNLYEDGAGAYEMVLA